MIKIFNFVFKILLVLVGYICISPYGLYSMLMSLLFWDSKYMNQVNKITDLILLNPFYTKDEQDKI